MPKAFNLMQSFHTQQSQKQDGLPSTKFLQVRNNTMTTQRQLAIIQSQNKHICKSKQESLIDVSQKYNNTLNLESTSNLESA